MNTTTSDLRQAALDAADRGWAVFPLHPDSKRPALHGEADCIGAGSCDDGHQGWEQRATTDPEKVERCWTPAKGNHGQWNVGIATGPSGLLVVDTDVAKPDTMVPEEYEQTSIRTGLEVLRDLEGVHGDLPGTYTVRTASGGMHQYYTAPADVELRNTTGRLGWLIDTRAAGGYVVAAGSTVNGQRYEVADPAPAADLPGWIREQLAPEQRTESTGLDLPSDPERREAYVRSAVQNEISRVLRSGAQQHNTALHQASANLGRVAAETGLDVAVLRGALQAAGEQVGQPGREAYATIASGLRNGGAHVPRSRPRTREQAAADARQQDTDTAPAVAAAEEVSGPGDSPEPAALSTTPPPETAPAEPAVVGPGEEVSPAPPPVRRGGVGVGAPTQPQRDRSATRHAESTAVPEPRTALADTRTGGEAQ